MTAFTLLKIQGLKLEHFVSGSNQPENQTLLQLRPAQLGNMGPWNS